MNVRAAPLLLAAIVAAGCAPRPAAPAPAVADSARFRGVTFDARRDPGPDALAPLARLGARHLMLTAFAFQPGLHTPALQFNPHGRWFTESDSGIVALAARARALGMGVVVKPHVWVGRGWSGDIALRGEADWQAWEAQYRDFALHYARLSEAIDAPLFVVGSELGRAVRARPLFWRRLVADVRRVYHGPVTYAANWHDDFERVPFWDALDYVGVQAYFPLGGARTPEALRQAWQPHLRRLAAVARRAGRPVLFTEMGYRSVGYAAAEPWRWPARGETAPADEALQAALYRAFFDAVWPQPWLAGVFVWKFHPLDERPRPLDFTPQGKKAEGVLQEGWARKGGPRRPAL